MPQVNDIVRILETLQRARLPVAVDCEGFPGNITCIAFADCAERANVIPLAHYDGRSVWSLEDEITIWQAVKSLLEDVNVPKIGHNFSYDAFALAWTYGITVQGEVIDTIELFWEVFCELPKGLAKVASLVTREPFYKPDREEGELKFSSDHQFWEYNGRDACVTWECWSYLLKMLDTRQRRHFRFNCELMAGKLFMILRGVKVDQDAVKEERELAKERAWELQVRIDLAVIELTECAGQPLNTLYCMLDNTVAWDSPFREQVMAKLCLCCLGGANPKVPMEVVVERWQLYKHNGKKWVKDGKLLAETDRCPSVDVVQIETPPANLTAKSWLKPAHKTVTRRLSFTPATLADCEDHILESKRSEWRRVKQIWKELKHDTQTNNSNTQRGDPALPGAFVTGQGEKGLRPQSPASSALLGELSLLLGLGINTGSNAEAGDSQWFLFEVCGLPKIFKNERTGKYSRESEKEWKARTGKGVSYGRKRKVKNDALGAGPAPAAPIGECDGRRERPAVEVGAAVESVAGVGEDDVGIGYESPVSGGHTREAVQPLPVPSKSRGKKPSTDQQALNLLYAHTKDERCLWVLQQRRLRKVVSDLKGDLTDHDGRARSNVSFVKETGRMAESEAPHGTGLGNRQALNKDLRRIVIAG